MSVGVNIMLCLVLLGYEVDNIYTEWMIRSEDMKYMVYLLKSKCSSRIDGVNPEYLRYGNSQLTAITDDKSWLRQVISRLMLFCPF